MSSTGSAFITCSLLNMAKRDKSQGFAFKNNGILYNFQTESKSLETEYISEDGLKYEIEKILVEAAELLESEYKTSEEILEMLIEDLEYLRKK